MATQPWYVTRERVKRVLDIAETARRNTDVDDAIEAATLAVDGLLNRTFTPVVKTESFDWPGAGAPRAWRLRMNERELATSTGVVITVGGGDTTLTTGQYVLRPNAGPPYNEIEINLGSAAAFSSGSTWQNAIAVTGTWMGQPIDDRPSGTLAAAIASTSVTTCDVSDSSVIGVGTILLCGTERMIVTGRSLLTTGQTSLAALDSDSAAQSITVTSGAALTVGELVTIDAERMEITAIAGNTLTVERAQDGSTLAAHLAGATIYAPRTLTVERGSLGTTAATHLISTALYRHTPLGVVRTLATAYALNTLLQQSSGYARVAGSGDNQREFTGRGIKSLEDDAIGACGRVARQRGVTGRVR